MSLRTFVEYLKLPESCNIPLFAGWWYKLTTLLDNRLILKETIPGNPLNVGNRSEKIIASLTSYPARIEYVWLAEEQFPTRTLSKNLRDLIPYGLEIEWIQDMYGHKKYYYPVKNQNENEVVITFDDDIIYSPKCIERLMNVHRKYPNCLVCERGQVFF